MKTRPVGAGLFRADGRTAKTNLTVDFHNFVNAPKNQLRAAQNILRSHTAQLGEKVSHPLWKLQTDYRMSLTSTFSQADRVHTNLLCEIHFTSSSNLYLHLPSGHFRFST